MGQDHDVLHGTIKPLKPAAGPGWFKPEDFEAALVHDHDGHPYSIHYVNPNLHQ